MAQQQNQQVNLTLEQRLLYEIAVNTRVLVQLVLFQMGAIPRSRAQMEQSWLRQLEQLAPFRVVLTPPQPAPSDTSLHMVEPEGEPCPATDPPGA